MGEGIRVLIIGGGLAGLAAALSTKLANSAHEVVVFEAAKELQEIGAGLQITPNATRLLQKWGVYEDLRQLATEPRTLTVHRYDGTRILAREDDLRGAMAQRYGAPFWDLHRVDLQRALMSRCAELGIPIRCSSRVAHVSFDEAIVEIEGLGREKGDVVVCAEGLWSNTRAQFLGEVSEPAATGDLAYRISVDTTKLSGPHAEEIRDFARNGGVNFWIGPDGHVASYGVRGGDMFNLGLLRPDNLPAGTIKTTAHPTEVVELFSEWDPFLLRVLTEVKSVNKWRLLYLETLKRWANESGTFYMVGDSCHPMLPYLAQGANSALEDGAVLGVLLSKVTATKKQEQLKKVSGMYQALRRDRGAEIQRESSRQREAFHLPDGEEQRARDEVMLESLERGPSEPFPSRWTCPRVQRFLYGYDAYAEAEGAYSKDPF